MKESFVVFLRTWKYDRESGQKVHLQHVKGHSGEAGNEGADYLATEGTLKSPVEEPDWKALNARLVKVLNSIVPNTALVQGSVDPGQFFMTNHGNWERSGFPVTDLIDQLLRPHRIWSRIPLPLVCWGKTIMPRRHCHNGR
jgi:hypothetical protein